VKLSVVIPARNEEGSIRETVSHLAEQMRAASIPCEIVVVDDGSSDGTAARAGEAAAAFPEIRLVANTGRCGFGMAVRAGIAESTGDAVAVMMADGSDSPADLATYYARLLEGCDCVFGSRFIRGSQVVDYPPHKLVLNRLANWFIEALFGFTFNDTTNAFKCYRRSVIDGIQPLISPHFNLTVELPLKAIVRGYTWTVLPITWRNRRTGTPKLKIREMGSRYIFICLYVWLEKYFSRGDYRRRE
jgi:dolichol-phosphate mannosyltransferase